MDSSINLNFLSILLEVIETLPQIILFKSKIIECRHFLYFFYMNKLLTKSERLLSQSSKFRKYYQFMFVDYYLLANLHCKEL